MKKERKKSDHPHRHQTAASVEAYARSEGTVHLEILQDELPKRPKRFSECEGAKRGTPGDPCPFVTCFHNTLAKPYRGGGLFFPFPVRDESGTPFDVDWSAAAQAGVFTCSEKEISLDSEGTLKGIGDSFGGLSRERIRQIESGALEKILPEIAKIIGMTDGSIADSVAFYKEKLASIRKKPKVVKRDDPTDD